MQNTRQKIDDAKWLLERMLNWNATADVKTGIALTLQIAMFGGLAAAYGASTITNKTDSAYFFISIACGTLLSAASYAASAALPRVSGPVDSNIFFGRVACKSLDLYVREFNLADDVALLKDLTIQIHRNAEIATTKHANVKSSLEWTLCSVLPWSVAILLLM